MMNRIAALRASAALAALFASISLQAAYAQDVAGVAQRLKETVSEQGGVEIGWSNVQVNGAQVVIENATYGAPGLAPFAIGNVTLDGVAAANGGYTVESMSFPAINFTHEGITVTGSSAVLNKVRVPAPNQADFLDGMLLYESGRMDQAEVRLGDKSVASVENIHFDMPAPVDGKLTFTSAADKFSADLTAIPDPKTQAIATALGYQQITGNLQMNGSWNLNDGRMEISKYDITVDNAAKLGMTFDIGGYTPELLKAMQDISKKMAENPAGDQTAQNLAMLGLMQQLVFNGASVRIDDASLTDKVLNFMAQQQGADPAQLKEQTKTIIPFLLASSPIKDEAFKQQVTQAVGAYLDNPKSLTIRAKPATPQPFAVLAAQGQADPASLVPTLGVTVTAND